MTKVEMITMIEAEDNMIEEAAEVDLEVDLEVVLEEVEVAFKVIAEEVNLIKTLLEMNV